MKRLILLYLFFSLFSCQEKFNPNEFDGAWINFNENYNSYLPSIIFKNDSVYISDSYIYTKKGNYNITRNKLSLFFKDDTLTFKFSYKSKDTTIFIGNKKYGFWEDYYSNVDFFSYELANLNKKRNISADSLSKFDNGFHLFKNSQDSLKIKLNDKITSDLQQIRSFACCTESYRGKLQVPASVVYIGKEVRLKDIIKIYFPLFSVNLNQVMLVTGFDLKYNLYEGYLDKFEIWDEQDALHLETKIEVPISIDNNRKLYIKKYSPQILTIDSSSDFNKLKSLTKENNYLIQINTNMDLKTYIKLKEKLSKIRELQKIRIRTEFNLYLSN